MWECLRRNEQFCNDYRALPPEGEGEAETFNQYANVVLARPGEWNLAAPWDKQKPEAQKEFVTAYEKLMPEPFDFLTWGPLRDASRDPKTAMHFLQAARFHVRSLRPVGIPQRVLTNDHYKAIVEELVRLVPKPITKSSALKRSNLGTMARWRAFLLVEYWVDKKGTTRSSAVRLAALEIYGDKIFASYTDDQLLSSADSSDAASIEDQRGATLLGDRLAIKEQIDRVYPEFSDFDDFDSGG